MPIITSNLKKIKGCDYCNDKAVILVNNNKRKFCPYETCKYHEIDDCETYEEYCKKEIPMSPELSALLAVFREYDEPMKRGKIPR